MILVIVSTSLSIAAGLFLFLRPAKAIEIQVRFYEKINWRISPISLSREIRNTQLMGLFLILVSLSAVGYVILNLNRYILPSRIYFP
ncbi:MAG: hypothetical protein Q8N14_00630 [Candidatus Omnitrophota bacterium]|nr:hypothetical protein [Candidatus Omnitrophota bacterium]